MVEYSRGKGSTHVRQICYGRLDQILEFTVPDHPFWRELQGKLLLVATITPCVTQGKDATKENVLYRKYAASVMVDLRVVEATVGRVQTRGRWGIIDRSGDGARTIFTNPDDVE